MQETWVWFLGWEDPLEKEMATHSSTLAWRIPWREEPSRLQSMGLQRVRHDWATSLSFTFPGGSDGTESVCDMADLGSIPGSGRSPGERNGNPLQYSCQENSMDRGAWGTIVHAVLKNWTWLSDWDTSMHGTDCVLTHFLKTGILLLLVKYKKIVFWFW